MLIQGENLDEQIAAALSDERAKDVAVFCASYQPALEYLTQLLKESVDARDHISELYIQKDFNPDNHKEVLQFLIDDITRVSQGLAEDVHFENAHLMAQLYANDILAYTEVEQTGKLVGYASLLGYPLAVLEDMKVVRNLKSHTYAEQQAADFYQEATLNIYQKFLAEHFPHQVTKLPQREYKKRFGHSHIASALSRVGESSVERFTVKSAPSGNKLKRAGLVVAERNREEFYSDGSFQVIGKGEKKTEQSNKFIIYPSIDIHCYHLTEQRKLISRKGV